MSDSSNDSDDAGPQQLSSVARYIRDNPLATVAAALIAAAIILRFAFLGNARDER